MVYHRKNRFLNYSNSMARSSRPEVFLRKGVPKICSKFTGEHPCRSAISIKLLCNFIEIALPHGCSPVNLLHIFRAPFSRNTSGWLLLFSPPSYWPKSKWEIKLKHDVFATTLVIYKKTCCILIGRKIDIYIYSRYIH